MKIVNNDNWRRWLHMTHSKASEGGGGSALSITNEDLYQLYKEKTIAGLPQGMLSGVVIPEHFADIPYISEAEVNVLGFWKLTSRDNDDGQQFLFQDLNTSDVIVFGARQPESEPK